MVHRTIWEAEDASKMLHLLSVYFNLILYRRQFNDVIFFFDVLLVFSFETRVHISLSIACLSADPQRSFLKSLINALWYFISSVSPVVMLPVVTALWNLLCWAVFGMLPLVNWQPSVMEIHCSTPRSLSLDLKSFT